MKKIKPNRKKRVENCSAKIRKIFYGSVIPLGDMVMVDKFNSEWGQLASEFSSGGLSMAQYERKVDQLCKEWERRLTVH